MSEEACTSSRRERIADDELGCLRGDDPETNLIGLKASSNASGQRGLEFAILC